MQDDELSESDDDCDAYQQLVGTLSKGSKIFVDLLKRKEREEAGKEEDAENSVIDKSRDFDNIGSKGVLSDQNDDVIIANDVEIGDNVEMQLLETFNSNGIVQAVEKNIENPGKSGEDDMTGDDYTDNDDEGMGDESSIEEEEILDKNSRESGLVIMSPTG